MNTLDIKKLLDLAKGVDAYRISEKSTESYELFFVHDKLETKRSTDTVDVTVTVYVDHEGKRGDSSFTVGRAMTEDDVVAGIAAAAERAKLVFNPFYELPEAGSYEKSLGGNLSEYDLDKSAAAIADAAFAAAAADDGCSLNALEVFVYRDSKRVINSRGVDKTQRLTRAAVEAIPTYTDENGSVELYEMMRFTDLDPERVTAKLSDKMREVKERAKAKAPGAGMKCGVALHPFEISCLVDELAYDLYYSNVYASANVLSVGDSLGKGEDRDRLTVTARASVPGSDSSAYFDSDGTDLCDTVVIEDGVVKNYFGPSRFGQYLGVEKPSGDLRCLGVRPGTLDPDAPPAAEYIEVISMSGLQVDVNNDYLGGEVRLAYLVRDGKKTPITGISFSIRLSDALDGLRLSRRVTVEDEYEGPDLLFFDGAEIL